MCVFLFLKDLCFLCFLWIKRIKWPEIRPHTVIDEKKNDRG
jgi:hypothetical protein